jgi:hypothetical protein
MSLLKVAGTTASSGTLYVDDVFSTWLYTGNGSTQTITNGIDLAGKGGLVWVKSRSATTNNFLFDTTRGVNVEINSNTTDANATLANSVTAFNSSGFALGSAAGINVSAATYASWTFRKAAKFFDVVTFTSSASGNKTFNHNLGSTPGCVIIKNTQTADGWLVYHRSVGNNAYLLLNTTAGQDPLVGAFSATSTTFTISSSLMYNSQTYVAYLYAHDTSSTGIIQCGSYTGNGTTNNISLGWEAQYVLIKSASNARPWVIFDTMRGFCNSPTPSSKALFPNASTAETPYYGPTPTATGFGTTSGDGDNDYNGSGQTYIYMAIRRPNKPPTTGTQVYTNAIQTTGITPTTSTTGFVTDLIIQSQSPSAANKFWSDRLRGTTSNNYAYVISNSTSVEATGTGGGIGLDNNTGFSNNLIGMNPTYNWNFKRAPGFFDEVCWTGVIGATNQRVNHNLTVAPELIIYKGRNKVNYWRVYYGNINQYIALNLDSAVVTGSNFWGSSAPTTADFGINCGSMDLDNFNAVAYLFATLAGISKVGSYTGNGTGQAIACGFGSAGARFVLIKRTDSTGGWYTFDSARGLTSGSSPYLLLNSTAAETTGNNGVYASSGGFTLGATAITTTNIASASYIYLSVA